MIWTRSYCKPPSLGHNPQKHSQAKKTQKPLGTGLKLKVFFSFSLQSFFSFNCNCCHRSKTTTLPIKSIKAVIIGAMSFNFSLKVPGIRRIIITKIRMLLIILKLEAILSNDPLLLFEAPSDVAVAAFDAVENKIIELKSKIKNKAISIYPSVKSCQPDLLATN